MKRETKESINNTFRIHNPYGVCYNDTHYFYFNRYYKNVGNPDKSTYVEYPDVNEQTRIYFYNDATRPCKFDKNYYKLLTDYENKLLEFEDIAHQKNLVKIDFNK